MLCWFWVLSETLLITVPWDYICFSLLIYFPHNANNLYQHDWGLFFHTIFKIEVKNIRDKYLKIPCEATENVISHYPSGQRQGDGVVRYFFHIPFSDSSYKNCKSLSYTKIVQFRRKFPRIQRRFSSCCSSSCSPGS